MPIFEFAFIYKSININHSTSAFHFIIMKKAFIYTSIRQIIFYKTFTLSF